MPGGVFHDSSSNQGATRRTAAGFSGLVLWSGAEAACNGAVISGRHAYVNSMPRMIQSQMALAKLARWWYEDERPSPWRFSD